MSLNPKVIDLLLFAVQVPPQGDDPGDLVDRKAPVVSYRVLPKPIPDGPVGTDVDVDGFDPRHLRVDAGVLVDPDGLVPGGDHKDRGMVIEVL